jgi:hypothetical protein
MIMAQFFLKVRWNEGMVEQSSMANGKAKRSLRVLYLQLLMHLILFAYNFCLQIPILFIQNKFKE